MSFVDSITAYLRSSKSELEKVSWPSKNDTLRYSALVVGISLVTALFFATLDFGLQKGISLVIQSRTPNAVTAQQEVPLTEPIVPLTTGDANVEATTPNGTPADVEVTPLPINAPSNP